MLETEIDDASPQLLGPLVDRLLAAGRARRLLHAGADEEGPARRAGHRDRAAVRARGARGDPLPRDDDARRAPAGVGCAPRSSARRPTVETAYGPIRVKIGRRRGTSTTPGPSSTTASVRPERRASRSRRSWPRPSPPGAPARQEGHERTQAHVDHHDADLLRQRRAARRPRLHHDRRRHARPRAAAGGAGRLLPDRHRRARAEHRAHRARARDLGAGALRPDLGGVPRAVGALRGPLRRLHPHDGRAPPPRRAQAVGAAARGEDPGRPRRDLPRPLRRLVLPALRGLQGRGRAAPAGQRLPRPRAARASGPRRRTSSSASRPTRTGCARRSRATAC